MKETRLLLLAVLIFALNLSCGDPVEKLEIESYFERHITDENDSLKDKIGPHTIDPFSDAQDSPKHNENDESSPKETLKVPEHAIAKMSERENNGHCDNDLNQTHLYASHHEFAENIANCVVMDLWKFSAHLDVNCIQAKYPEMTRQCFHCFAGYTKCAADKCKGDCAPWPSGNGKRSIECKKCSWYSCGDEMRKCTGLPLRRLPDFKRD